MNKPLNSQIAVVTGASGGLGSHVTRALLDAGAHVIGIARNIERSQFESASFVAYRAELSDAAATTKVMNEVVAKFGRIDILAHLVGGFTGGKTVAEIDESSFHQMFELNVTSAFYVLRAVIPHMRQAGSGRIIAIGSRAAEEPGPGVGAYSASKAALVSLVRTVALENKDRGITANVILPGTMDTPGNRQAMPQADTSQWVSPESVASLIVWLASEAGKDVTGAAIPVYGRGI